MDSRERINARYLMAAAGVIAAGVAFTFWQNAAYNAAARTNAYTPGAESPSRVLLVIGLLAAAGALAAIAYSWRRKLALLDSAGQGGTAVQQPQDQSS